MMEYDWMMEYDSMVESSRIWVNLVELVNIGGIDWMWNMVGFRQQLFYCLGYKLGGLVAFATRNLPKSTKNLSYLTWCGCYKCVTLIS